MIRLPKTLNAFNSNEFVAIFKQELIALDHHKLPLQQGLSLSSYVSDEKISPILKNSLEDESHLIINTGIFYTGIIAGCSCSDDPTPLDTQNEYCEIIITIEKTSAEAHFKLLIE